MTFMVLQFIVSYCCDFEMTKWQIIFSGGLFGSFIKHENMFREQKVSQKWEAFWSHSWHLSISWPNYRTQPILCTIETSRAKRLRTYTSERTFHFNKWLCHSSLLPSLALFLFCEAFPFRPIHSSPRSCSITKQTEKSCWRYCSLTEAPLG